MKEIDFKKTVFELTELYPELIEILKEMGFLGVKNPVIRKTVGKMMTIPKGCQKMGEDVNEVIKKLEEKGFKLK